MKNLLILFLLLTPITIVAQDNGLLNKEFNVNVMKCLNVKRVEAGLNPVEYISTIQPVLNNKAKKLKKQFKHSRSSGGEVILMNSLELTPEEIINQFFDSHPHRSILMDKKIKYVCSGTYILNESYNVMRVYYSKEEGLKDIF